MKEERQSETLYVFRRDWVGMFTTSVNITEDMTCTSGNQQSVNASLSSDQAVGMAWLLPKPWTGSSRFTDKVKNYLTARFDLGEQTEHKADPQWVSNDMRMAREEQNNRQFDRQEWLSKSQVQGFFPHPTASRRRQQCSTEIELNTRELLLEEEEADRQHLIDEVTKEPKP